MTKDVNAVPDARHFTVRPGSRVFAAERRWVLGFALVVMLLTTIPYFIGFAVQNGTWRFTGFVFGVEDGNSYIAKMLSGAAGAWLFRTPYTAYPQQGVLTFIPYLLLGKLAAPPGMHTQLVALYHLFRVVAGIMVIWATYDFLAFFLPSLRLRRLGLVVAILGGGLGWILVLLGKTSWLGSLPLEFYSPETFGFLELYGIPHLALARAFLLWGLVAYLEAVTALPKVEVKLRKKLRIGLLWLLTGLAQPLTGMIVGAVVGIHLVALVIWQIGRRVRHYQPDWLMWRRSAGVAIVAGLIPAPFVLYNVFSFNLDPILRTWTQQSYIPSPHPLHYLLAYGLLLPFACAGALKLLRARPWSGWLPAAWILALPVLAYAPFSLQRRLVEGAWLALVVLALYVFQDIEINHRTASYFRAFQITSVLLLLSTLILIAGGVSTAIRPGFPAFRPVDEVAVFQSLAAKVRPGEVVLSAYDTGNALPAWAPVRVVIGHGPESANLAELRPKVSSFYQTTTLETQRLALLQTFRVRYVFWGPAEQALGSWNPAVASYLKLLVQIGDYSVFEYTPNQPTSN